MRLGHASAGPVFFLSSSFDGRCFLPSLSKPKPILDSAQKQSRPRTCGCIFSLEDFLFNHFVAQSLFMSFYGMGEVEYGEAKLLTGSVRSRKTSTATPFKSRASRRAGCFLDCCPRAQKMLGFGLPEAEISREMSFHHSMPLSFCLPRTVRLVHLVAFSC